MCTVAGVCCAITYMRSENVPLTQQMASSPGSNEFSTAASMPPEPEAESGNVTRFSVWKICRNRVCVSSMHPRNQGSMWPTSWVASARYTRGSMEEGPGVIIRRTGGLSSPMGLDMSLPRIRRIASRHCGDTSFPQGGALAQPSNWYVHRFYPGALNRHSFERDDELNAGDLTIVEAGIVGDEQVHAKRGCAGELNGIWRAHSRVAAQLRVDHGGLLIKWQQNGHLWNHLRILFQQLGVAFLHRFDEHFAERQ